MIKKNIKKITAFAPASSANLAVGFDILGFPFGQLGDEVSLSLRQDNDIVIQSIDATAELPYENHKNTATVALDFMLKALDLDVGLDIEIKKGIPLSSGLGGSAATAVAAITALNGLLEVPYPKNILIDFALESEKVASGERHADNVVPCLWGDLTMVYSLRPLELISLPMPDLFCVFVHPDFEIPTEKARGVLSSSVTFKQHISQLSRLGLFISALYRKEYHLLSEAGIDDVVEPQRASLLPGFYNVKNAALEKGALMASFSGAGPTMFALCDTQAKGVEVALAMQNAFTANDLPSQSWVQKMEKSTPEIIERVEA